jgi:hypothetical protein
MRLANPLWISVGFAVAACGGDDFSSLFSPLEGDATIGSDVATRDAGVEHASVDAGPDIAPPISNDAGTESSRDVVASEASTSDAPAPCVPSQEICNGVDDDCDGIIDEKCPARLAWDAAVKRPALGDSPGGDEFSETCDGDELLVGVRVGSGAWVDQVRGVCRKVTLAYDQGKKPYEYTLALGASRELAPHPASTTSPIRDLVCSGNKILVGLRISEQWYTAPTGEKKAVIPTIWATCAEPALDLGATPPRLAWQSSAEIGPITGSLADNTAWFAKDAVESPTVHVGLHGGAGSWVDRVGLSSATMGVVFR